MKNVLTSYNKLSISRRLFILFSLPQLLLTIMLIFELQESLELTHHLAFILAAMVSLAVMYVLIQRTITQPLLYAVRSGLDSLSVVMSNFTLERKDANKNCGGDDESEIRRTINAFYCLATELNDIVEHEKEINADLEGKAEFILDVVSRAAKGDLTADMMIFWKRSGNKGSN